MKFEIFNNSSRQLNLDHLINSLMGFAQKRLGFETPPSLFLDSDNNNASLPLGKTAFYNPESFEIHVFVDSRHPKDILRSIAHELVHHTQNEQGFLNDGCGHPDWASACVKKDGQPPMDGPGYAQQDPQLRKAESDAYEKGNMCFRDWEDGYKQKQPTIYNERREKMSLKEWKNKELGQQLMSKWGFNMDLNVLGEETGLLKEEKDPKLENKENEENEEDEENKEDDEAENNLEEAIFKKVVEILRNSK